MIFVLSLICNVSLLFRKDDENKADVNCGENVYEQNRNPLDKGMSL